MEGRKTLLAVVSTCARCLPGDRRGTAAIEFALVAPVLLLLLVGMIKFGIAVNQYHSLTNVGLQGATVLAFSRGNPTPYSRTVAAITSASDLVAGSITITVKIDGTTCSDDASCRGLLVQGAVAEVRVSYPCDLSLSGSGSPSICTLTGTSRQMVQ